MMFISLNSDSADARIPVYPQGNKVFLPSETKIFIRLLKYGKLFANDMLCFAYLGVIRHFYLCSHNLQFMI